MATCCEVEIAPALELEADPLNRSELKPETQARRENAPLRRQQLLFVNHNCNQNHNYSLDN